MKEIKKNSSSDEMSEYLGNDFHQIHQHATESKYGRWRVYCLFNKKVFKGKTMKEALYEAVNYKKGKINKERKRGNKVLEKS